LIIIYNSTVKDMNSLKDAEDPRLLEWA